MVEVTTDRAMLLGWIDAKGHREQPRDGVHAQVFYEGAHSSARTMRFGLMMLFSSVISALGVLTDATAVVIGAMLIAPLISPMMGMGLSLAMGWPNRLARSGLLVLAGVVIAIGSGWLLAAVLDLGIDLQTNSQVTSRSSPTIADLFIAVAAGAAGAYALSREDVSSSLPGVAIAIALVPPLSVVGVAARGGDWVQAAGTAVLFLTNLTAILLVGGLNRADGCGSLSRVAEQPHGRLRRPRGRTGVVVLCDNTATIATTASPGPRPNRRWRLGRESSEFEVVTVTVDDGNVAVVLIGPGTPPSSAAPPTGHTLERPISLDLQWVPRNRIRVESFSTP